MFATMVSVFGGVYTVRLSGPEPEAGVEIPGGMIEINLVRNFGGICTLKFVGKYGERIGEYRWLSEIPTTGCNWHGEMDVENGDNGSMDRLRLMYNMSQHISRTIILTNIEKSLNISDFQHLEWGVRTSSGTGLTLISLLSPRQDLITFDGRCLSQCLLLRYIRSE